MMPSAPASPPKRMTRARAKAVEEKQQATASAKPSLQKETASSRARSKAAADAKDEKKVQPAAKKAAPAKSANTRARQATTTKTSTSRPPASKQEPEGGDDVDELNDESVNSTAAASTRSRVKKQPTPSTAKPPSRATRTTKPTPTQKTAAKKAVSFENDKENKVQLAAKTSKKHKDSDLAASKKPANPQADAHRTDAAQPPEVELRAKNEHIEPLSPKKGYQTSSDAQPSSRPGSSDKDSQPAPDNMLASPAKRSIHIRKESTQTDVEDELHDSTAPSVLASPAKRPPQQIQENLRFESTTSLKAASAGSEDSSANDILSRSPVKLPGVGTSSTDLFRVPNHTSSVLAQSPARRPPSPSKATSHAHIAATPQDKTRSLLQSPARRPPATVHGIKFGIQKPRDAVHGSEPITASRLQQKPMKFAMPPPKNPFASPERLRAAAEAQRLVDDSQDIAMEEADAHQDDVHTHSNAASTVRDSISGPFEFVAPPVQWSSDAESEDELSSNDPKFDASPSRRRWPKVDAAPSTPSQVDVSLHEVPEPTMPMTVLAERFGAWAGATPDQAVIKSRSESLQPFAPSSNIMQSPVPKPITPLPVNMAALESSFEEAMQVHEDDVDRDELMADALLEDKDGFRISQISDASQEYGDENAAPTPRPTAAPVFEQPTCTPERIFRGSMEASSSSSHKVSKVPLKPAAEDPVPRKNLNRSKSLSGVLTPLKQSDDRLSGVGKQRRVQTSRTSKFVENLPESSTVTPVKSHSWSAAPTPARTPRHDLNTSLLSGAVVFVDVHTTEGADASEIFIDLLNQMGARCVKSWNWNPNASSSVADAAGDSRVGITHVVFKDGGIKTMEKVRQAKGLVQCVGVGWVLDCEKENVWMDESDYAIDESTIPRGGHRRRKSMEPRMLSNSMGSLSARPSPRKLSGSLSPENLGISPSKEFLNLDSPNKASHRRTTFAAPTSSDSTRDRRVSFMPPAVHSSEPSTPERSPANVRFKPVSAYGTPPAKASGSMDMGALSPTTPYFLHAAQLEQQTCPPKQSQQLFFPVSGDIAEEQDSTMRHKLLAARRKSLQFAPRVQSPLSKER